MEKLYRVQMNKYGMPNFSTAEEVEPCKDAVSRQAVIDMLDGLSVDAELGFEFGTEEETFIGKFEAITNVSDLPSVTVEPKQAWIPCEERLPSENDEYIITMGKDGFDKEGNVTWAMFDKLKKKFYFPGGRVNYYIAVTAWMPKPEPWKGINNE